MYLRRVIVVLAIGIGIIACNSSVFAVPPPELAEEINSKAGEILIGTVLGIYPAPEDWVILEYTSDNLRYFTFKIEQVERTSHHLESGDIIRIVFVYFAGIPPPGPSPVHVKEGDLIRLYADSTALGEDVFEPVIWGNSIEHLEGIPKSYTGEYTPFVFMAVLGLVLVILIYLVHKHIRKLSMKEISAFSLVLVACFLVVLYFTFSDEDIGLRRTPAIYEDITVWEELRNQDWDIYGYNLKTREEFRITADPSIQVNPAIYGNIIVWEDHRNRDWDIYGYNLTTREEFQIVTDRGDQHYPAIYGDYVVWEDWNDFDIYGYNLQTKEKFQITNDPEYQSNPAIYGDYVVWGDYRDFDRNIYGYNLQTKEKFQITTDPNVQHNPAIYGNYVVWEDERNQDWDVHSITTDIYGYNLETREEFQITTNESVQLSPAIYGNYVVWEDWRNGNVDIYGYNLETREEFQITTNESVQHNPAIYGDYVVWEGWRNGARGIYGYNLQTREEFQIAADPENGFWTLLRFCFTHLKE